MKMIFTSILKSHTAFIAALGFEEELPRYLATNYHSMIQDVRYVANKVVQRPEGGILVGLFMKHLVPVEDRPAVTELVGELRHVLETKSAEQVMACIMDEENFEEELLACGPKRLKLQTVESSEGVVLWRTRCSWKLWPVIL